MLVHHAVSLSYVPCSGQATRLAIATSSSSRLFGTTTTNGSSSRRSSRLFGTTTTTTTSAYGHARGGPREKPLRRSFRLFSNIRSVSKPEENVDVGVPINSGLGEEKLLYVDNDIIVVDKPSNAQTAPGFIDKDSLATRLSVLFNIERVDKMIVHRLDYATSGVVVFARTEFALIKLHEQFRKRQPRKTYTAIVGGRIQQAQGASEGEVDCYLGRDWERGAPYCKVVDPTLPKARHSITHWRVLATGKNVSKVLLQPQTGRTHQLRLHMLAIGHPIVGDLFYAPSDVYLKSPSRLLLHAQELILRHPRSNESLRFFSPSPFCVEDFDQDLDSNCK